MSYKKDADITYSRIKIPPFFYKAQKGNQSVN